MRDSVGSLAGQVRDRATLSALASLGRAGFILATTNYDGLLAAETGHRPVTWQERGLVERVVMGDEPGILHLHGFWERPASVILGDDDYEAVVGDDHAQTLLRALRMTHTFVFVGHGAGLGDRNWSGFLRWTERVFEGSEYAHYRLVRGSEREAVQAQHPPAQRIFAVPYGDTHADLAPFLRELVPPEAAATGDAAETAVLLVNLTDAKQTPADPAVIKAQLDWRPGDPWVAYAEAFADFSELGASDWRRIAAELDRCVAELRAIVPRPRRLVVAGQAPLPVFLYLGQWLNSYDGVPVWMLHLQRVENASEPSWKLLPPLEQRPPATDDLFVVTPPMLNEDRGGRVVLAITSASTQVFHKDQARPMLEAAGRRFLAAYTIHNPNSQRERAMTHDDLYWLRRHVEDALAWFGRECRHDGVTVAFAGPAWAALCVGRWLSPKLTGPLELPNFAASKRRYVPALSWPAQRVPWVHPPLRVLVALAEPNDEASTRASRERGLIERSLKLAGARVQLEVLPDAKVSELVALIKRHRPHLLHISSHGSEGGELGLEDVAGDCQKLHITRLGELLESAEVRPALVVLSACNLGDHVEPLRRRADVVVGMAATLHRKFAEPFVSTLYSGIVGGDSVATAVDHARLVGDAAYPLEGALRVETAEGVDAGEVTLLAPPR